MAPARCPLTGLAGGLAVRLGGVGGPTRCPRLQVRSSQTKLISNFVLRILVHTPDLGTFPTPPRTKQPPDISNPGIHCAATSPEPKPALFRTSLFLRNRARRRATRLLRDDSAKARGFLPSPWRTLKCPWRQKSSSGTVSPPFSSHSRMRATLIASPRQSRDADS